MLDCPADVQHDHRNRGKLCVQCGVKIGKLRHHVGHQERQHHGQCPYQQRRIPQRRDKLLAEGDRNPLESDITAQDFFKIAAALARQQRGGVDF